MTTPAPTPQEVAALMLRLSLLPGVAEYEQGYAAGRAAGREEAALYYAQRADEIDATWQTVERPSYEERVAERIAEMERAAANLPDLFEQVGLSRATREKAVLEMAQRRVFRINGCPLPTDEPPAAATGRPALRLVSDAPERGTVA